MERKARQQMEDFMMVFIFHQVGGTFEFDEVHLDGEQTVMENQGSSRFDEFEIGK